MFGGLFGGPYGGGNGTFEKVYRAMPVAFIDKQTAEYGDKIIMPPSALETLGEKGQAAKTRQAANTRSAGYLFQGCHSKIYWATNQTCCPLESTLRTCFRSFHAASLHIEYPMLFKLEGLHSGRLTHCGVLEFIAEEGVIYMPHWVRGYQPAAWLTCAVHTSRMHICLPYPATLVLASFSSNCIQSTKYI